MMFPRNYSLNVTNEVIIQTQIIITSWRDFFGVVTITPSCVEKCKILQFCKKQAILLTLWECTLAVVEFISWRVWVKSIEKSTILRIKNFSLLCNRFIDQWYFFIYINFQLQSCSCASYCCYSSLTKFTQQSGYGFLRSISLRNPVGGLTTPHLVEEND